MNTSASKVQYIKEKRVRIPDKRAKGYDKRVWAHSLVVHNLVNFHFFTYLCIRNQAKKQWKTPSSE